MSHASHGTRNGRAPANTARACARGYVNGPRLERRAQKTAGRSASPSRRARGGIARGKPCCKHAAAGGSSGTTRQGATVLIRDADGNTGMFRRLPIPVKAIWLRIPRRPRGTGTRSGCHARHGRNRSTCVSRGGWHPSGWARVGGRLGRRSRLKPDKLGAGRYALLGRRCTSPARCLRIRSAEAGWRPRHGSGQRAALCLRPRVQAFQLPAPCSLSAGTRAR